MSGDMALFEMHEEMQAPPSVTAVAADTVRGHIGFADPEEHPNPYGAFFDTGDGHLSLWSGRGFSLNPAMAHELASALHRWARKNEGPRSRFDGDPLEALHGAERLLSELQFRVVRARRYVSRHSNDAELLGILGGSVAGDER